jgi:hypothetical protein
MTLWLIVRLRIASALTTKSLLFSKTTRKKFFYADFCHFGFIWAPQNGPKKIYKGLQVGGMYGPLYKLKDRPLNKSLGPFL